MSQVKYDRLFSAARNAEPLISPEEIRLGGPVVKKWNHITLKIIFMTTLLSVLTALYFLWPAEPVAPATPTEPASKSRIEIQEKPPVHKDMPARPFVSHGKKRTLPSADHHPDSTVKHEVSATHPDLDMKGVQLLTLDRDALLKLGVIACRNGVYVNYGEGLSLIYTSGGVITPIPAVDRDFSGQEIALMQRVEKDTMQRASPTLVTDDLGQYWRSYSYYEDAVAGKDKDAYQRIQSMISTMIPVLVRTGGSADGQSSKGQWRQDVILWYEPTDMFLAMLPGLIAGEIKAEKEALLNSIHTQDSFREEPGTKAEPCQYFESCISDRKLISDLVVYPNPAEGTITLNMQLAETRSLTFFISDISGKLIREQKTQAPQAKGNAEYRFDLTDLPPGMYLLLIVTDKGEKYSERIIKK